MDPLGEDELDRILTHIDLSRRSDDEATFTVGPFTLYRDFARPTIGSTSFTVADVRELLRYADEEPPWASIARNKLLVEWSELEWIVERARGLARAASDAGLTVVMVPLLTKRAGIDEGRGSVSIDAETEIVHPDSDPRERLAVWDFMDDTSSTPPWTADEILDQIQLSASSESGKEVVSKMRDEASGGSSQMVVRFQGRIVAVGRHEPFLDVSEITSLAVLPPFRRRGFGTALAAALAADAFDRGVQLIFVESTLEAVTMYERAGFRPIGAIGRAPL